MWQRMRAGKGAPKGGRRRLAVCLAWVWLAGAVALLGCGGSGAGTGGATGEQNARLHEEGQRRAAVVETLDILESVGMDQWAEYGRYLLEKGRIRFVDFSSPSKNEFGVSGLDGAADIEGQMVYLDQTVCLKMPPRHLAIVMLDEMAHLYFRTSSHTYFDKLHAEFIQLWQTRYGRPFNELGPEDADYQEWWDAFFRIHPRCIDEGALPQS
ncbi:MAG TPA: hypothetical protein PLU39_14150 [Armatimonadota bacterium]|jgi:hypothetical protein|nr:hypothetical protein [Armatimonadota bacterium]HPO73428.1 hypothetical protein [Armatimonadota bacterium]HPT99005.1 hypothetical protein [Armatimonadota bacterium]